MSSERTTRRNVLSFGSGTVTVTVDHWLSKSIEFPPTADEIASDVDHLMGSVFQDAFKAIDRLNKDIQRKSLGDGDVTHNSTRSMTIDGVTMRVVVALHCTRDVPSYVLAMEADKVLQGTVPCMVHLMDKSLDDAEMPPGLSDVLSGLFGGQMPEGLGVMGIPADLFAGMSRGGPHGHQARGYADDAGNTGQYL